MGNNLVDTHVDTRHTSLRLHDVHASGDEIVDAHGGERRGVLSDCLHGRADSSSVDSRQDSSSPDSGVAASQAKAPKEKKRNWSAAIAILLLAVTGLLFLWCSSVDIVVHTFAGGKTKDVGRVFGFKERPPSTKLRPPLTETVYVLDAAEHYYVPRPGLKAGPNIRWDLGNRPVFVDENEGHCRWLCANKQWWVSELCNVSNRIKVWLLCGGQELNHDSSVDFRGSSLARVLKFYRDHPCFLNIVGCFFVKSRRCDLNEGSRLGVLKFKDSTGEPVGINHLLKLASVNNRNHYTYSDCYDLEQHASIFVPWFVALLGFCIYAYGWGKIESSSYGFLVFFVGLAIFVYGVYRVVRLYFYGF